MMDGDKPTKNQRIKALEDEVAALRALVSVLQVQIATRPAPVSPAHPWYPQPPYRVSTTWPPTYWQVVSPGQTNVCRSSS